MPTITLGFSPCPNDTFIFDALVNQKIHTRGLSFDVVLEDVETLNQWALAGKLDVTKLSYATLLRVHAQYALLHSGSALGNGVGPILVAKEQLPLEQIDTYRIAIPGTHTTANLLLTLAFPQATNKTEVLFSEIEQRVLSGEFDAGLLIHESRFTYDSKGLHRLIDLGDWWETETGAAIPLGGIAARRDLSPELVRTIDELIRESVLYAWRQYPELAPYVVSHAQEMDTDVMRKHIDLYVNEYTTDLGPVGEQAIKTLFQKAAAAKLIPEQAVSTIFY